METLLLIFRIGLALVFGVAGIFKLADLPGSRRALSDFGVPVWLLTPLGWGLPVIEIMVAAALIPLGSARIGAILAGTLLLIFASAIAVNLMRGNSPDCHCFGQLHSTPVSWSLFMRNLALAVIAGFIVFAGNGDPGLSLAKLLSDLKPFEALNLALNVVVLALLFVAFVFLNKLFKQQTDIAEKIEAVKKVIDEDNADLPPVERQDVNAPDEGLPIGAPAPNFSLNSLRGYQVSLDSLLKEGKPVLLIFVSPTCSPCRTMMPSVKAWERDYGNYVSFAVLSKGTFEENQSKMAIYEASHILPQEDSEIANAYLANWTPSAILVSHQGKIASRISHGEESIRALVHHTVTTGSGTAAENRSNGHIPQITIGNSLFRIQDPAPRFSLPDIHGNQVSLQSLLGKDVFLIFWDTECKHCQSIAEDIRRWESGSQNDSPNLVLIISGKVETVKPGDFRSLMLFDPDFEIGPLYGSHSTPSAILIDAQGRIASSLARGEDKVMALIGGPGIELPTVSVV